MPYRTPLPPRDRDIWEIHRAALAAARNLYDELRDGEHPTVVEPSGKKIANPAIPYLKALSMQTTMPTNGSTASFAACGKLGLTTMTIKKIVILPPLAFARFGSHPEPVASYTLEAPAAE